MGDPTDGWGELLDSLPATSSFVAPGQEDFFLYSQLREAGSGAQSASRSAAYPGSSPQQLGSTWPAATHPSHGHSTYVVQPAGGSPLPSHDRPPTHSNHGSPYQYYPQQPHQLTDQQLAQLKALDLASAGNSPGPPGPQAHDSPTRPSHQYTANPNYNPHGGYAPYTQAHDPHLPALAGAPAAPPPYGAMGPTDHQVYPHPFPAQAHQPPVQEQVQQPYPAYMQYSTRPSVPYPSQAPQGAHPSTAGPLAPSASPPGPQYASPPAPSAVPPLALPPQPATGPSVGSPAGGIRPPTSGSPHAAQAGARPYSLSPMAAGGEAFYGNGPVRHVVDDFRTSPLPGSLGEQTPDRMGTGGPGSASRFGYEAAGGAGLLEGRGTGGSGTGGSGGGGGARASASPSMQRYQAHVTSLERQIAELQKRCTDLNGALEAAQAARQELEAKRDEAAEELQQANSRVKQRESSLEAARAAHNAMSTELRQAQEELHSSKDALAAAKDEVAQWQDRAAELGKELEAAKKKIELLGDSERRLSAENMALRKEAQQLNESLIKSRIESSELRERLREAQQDAARQAHNVQSLASRAEAEHEGAAAQMTAMRARVQELEAHNSQLTYDLAAYRDEAARARAAADAAKAAWSTKPAGIVSDLPAASRQQGTISHSWLAGPADGPAVMPPRTAAATSGPPPPDSAAAHRAAPPYSSSSAPPPPQSGAELSSDAAAVAGVLRNLPPGVSFSRMDPETFRSMVRAEAEAMARASGGSDGGGGGGGGGAAGGGGGAYSRPADPSYQPRYEKPQYDPAPADRRSYDFESSRYAAADRFDGGLYGASGRGMGGGYGKYNDTAGGGPDVVMGARAEDRPPARQAWGGPSAPYPPSYEAGAPQVSGYGNDVRASMAAGGPVKSSAARALWAGPGQGPYDGSTHDTGSAAPASPPPPYAIHTTDSSYAFRQPANVVGAGVGGRQGGASGALGGGGGDKASGQSPFGTEDTAKALLARSKALEDQLMALCAEKTNLEAEFARMPLGAGRNLRERNRKAVVEQRLELLNKDISGVRMQLKRVGIK